MLLIGINRQYIDICSTDYSSTDLRSNKHQDDLAVALKLSKISQNQIMLSYLKVSMVGTITLAQMSRAWLI
jgi:hypothetical protein